MKIILPNFNDILIPRVIRTGVYFLIAFTIALLFSQITDIKYSFALCNSLSPNPNGTLFGFPNPSTADVNVTIDVSGSLSGLTHSNTCSQIAPYPPPSCKLYEDVAIAVVNPNGKVKILSGPLPTSGQPTPPTWVGQDISVNIDLAGLNAPQGNQCYDGSGNPNSPGRLTQFSGSRSYSTSSFADGNYQITIRVEDDNGSFQTSAVSFTVSHAAPITNDLIISPNPTSGAGTVTSSAGGINCGTGGTDCSEGYTNPTNFNLSASEDFGWRFDHWFTPSGTSPTSNPLVGMQITNASKTYEAHWRKAACSDGKDSDGDGIVDTGDPGCSDGNDDDESNIWRMLTVSNNPPVAGTVTAGAISGSKPGNGINCGGDCQEEYNNGTSVNINAAPAAGYTFSSWSGDADCTDGVVSMNGSRNCVANYVLAGGGPYTLNVSVAGTGGGTVTVSPVGNEGNGMSCTKTGGDCLETYPVDTIVTLTGMEDPGSGIVGWSGDVDCNDGSVTMSANLNCTATFNTAAPGTGTINIVSEDSSNNPVATTWDLDGPLGSPEESDSGSSFSYPSKQAGGAFYTFKPATADGGPCPAGFVCPPVINASTQALDDGVTITFRATYSPVGAGGEAVIITPASQNVDVGSSVSYTAEYDPDTSNPGDEIPITGLATWLSANPGIATSDGGGFYTGVFQGSVAVRARYNPGSGPIVGTANLDVNAPSTAGAPTCSPASQSILVGNVADFAGTDGDSPNCISCTWSATGANSGPGAGPTYAVSLNTVGLQTITLNNSVGPADTCEVDVGVAVCGDGQCEAAGGETCDTCAADCGVCAVPECDDDADNDGDGLRDFDGDGGEPDPGCTSPQDDSEKDPGFIEI